VILVNVSNSITEEIKERTALGTKAYCANLKFFKSRLVTKQSKLKLYRTVIRPIVTYASETWVLKETIIQKLLVFERKILRKIFGPTEENQIWRVKTNEELDKLIKHKNIINYINPLNAKLNPICHVLALLGGHPILHVSRIRVKAQRLSWFGHVQRMQDTRTVKKIFNWKPLTKRSQGRPKYRWEDNIKQYICQTKIKNWIACIQDRGKWKEVVEKAKTFN